MNEKKIPESKSDLQLMSRKETAKYLNVCINTLRTLDIPCTRIGGRRLVYAKSVVDGWILANAGDTRPPRNPEKSAETESVGGAK